LFGVFGFGGVVDMFERRERSVYFGVVGGNWEIFRIPAKTRARIGSILDVLRIPILSRFTNHYIIGHVPHQMGPLRQLVWLNADVAL